MPDVDVRRKLLSALPRHLVKITGTSLSLVTSNAISLTRFHTFRRLTLARKGNGQLKGNGTCRLNHRTGHRPRPLADLVPRRRLGRVGLSIEGGRRFAVNMTKVPIASCFTTNKEHPAGARSGRQPGTSPR